MKGDVGARLEFDRVLINHGVINESTDLNELVNDKDSGIYGYFAEKGIPLNAPSEAKRGVVCVDANTGNIVHTISCYESNKVWRRVGVISNGNQFKGWIEM